MTPFERKAADNFINYLRTLTPLAGYKISWSEWDVYVRFIFDYQSQWYVNFNLKPGELLSLRFDEIACHLIKNFDKYERTGREKQELKTKMTPLEYAGLQIINLEAKVADLEAELTKRPVVYIKELESW